MKLVRIGIILLASVVLALTAAPCWAPYFPPSVDDLMADSEVIALFTALKGNVTPHTVWQWPAEPPEGFDFGIRPTVTLRVKRPLMGCDQGEIMEIPSPLQENRYRRRYVARRPILIDDGRDILAYLRKEHGEYVAFYVRRVYGGKLRIDVYEADGWSWHTGKLAVDDALEIVADSVRRWSQVQAYDVKAKTSAQLVRDFGGEHWLDRRIVEELTTRGDAAALGDLLERLPDGTSRIAFALARIPGAEPVPHLTALLRMPCDEVPRQAVKGLARPEAKAAVPALIELLGRNDRWGRTCCLYETAVAMAGIGDPRGIRAVIEAAQEPANVRNLRSVIAALGASPDPQVEAFLLAHLRDLDAVALDHEDEHQVMAAAALALAKHGNEAGFQRLLELAEEERGWMWPPPLVEPLGELGDQRAVPFLLAVLADGGNESQYRQATRALVRIGDERAIEPLIRAIRRTHWELRAKLVRIMAGWDHPRMKAFLMAELKGGNREAMCEAAVALHERGVAEAADRVLAVLDRGLGGWGARERAAVYAALARIGDERAVPGLIAAMVARRGDRERIADALRSITGADLPARPAPWRKWWRENGEWEAGSKEWRKGRAGSP